VNDHDADDPMYWDEQFDHLQHSINDRQHELHEVADILASAADLGRRRSSLAKVLIVVLGAIAATNGAAAKLAGGSANWVIVVYTVVGLAIAAIGGLEAAFKLGERAAELTILAATCQSTVRDIDTRWQTQVGPAEGEERVVAARGLIEVQDARLADVQDRAARLGVNVALQVRELYGSSRPYLA
jgi:hypothetical protein